MQKLQVMKARFAQEHTSQSRPTHGSPSRLKTNNVSRDPLDDDDSTQTESNSDDEDVESQQERSMPIFDQHHEDGDHEVDHQEKQID
jgi:hypothetical protein